EHKLKMPPASMRPSTSEKELCKMADSFFGTDTILESPDDFSQHDQDKSPLSDSGFETRSEKTPSAPQSAESTGPKPLFHEVPIPPVITETRTEVVHVIRSYEPSSGDVPQSQPEEPVSPKPSPTFMELEPKPTTSSIKEKVKAFQMKASSEDEDHSRVLSKGMRVKEETHITTTTRMVYHSPPGSDGASERIEETMSVHDIMKAFQSGRDPSKELAGLFEHKSAVSPDVHKSAAETSGQHAEKDSQMKPKLERIIEVHIEKGPQSPCERTDIRMAIVADHLGLSWTELARELNFSVDEINQIRVENPNSLISQSFMLLKKWVTRDGKNATTDALTSVLTKINRIDIVTLLEGPIFDYGNISGTRSFADENNVFHDPADGWQNETSGGNVDSPTPARRITGGLLDRLEDSPDQCRDSITSYLKGEPGKFEANGSHAEVTPEAKTKSHFPESQSDVGKQSAKETLKPKLHGSGRAEEPPSPLAVYQKSLEETSKFVIEEPKPCVPVSMKKMSRTSAADGKPRFNLHEEEGSSGSEPKGEGYKVKTKKEIRHVEKKSHS
uniref:Death domain-containing protein n=1 Tax=Chinchilla lanigera TaxID=34839 RepID=A0A8C2YV00_CHILA